MKSTTMGAIFGLTALVTGCEENKESELANCNVGDGLQVQVIYHQVSGEIDHITVDLYKEGKIIGSLSLPKRINHDSSEWIQCEDGRKLNFRSGSTYVYFSTAPEKNKN